MRIIVGYGNTLRGEDGFGVDVIDRLQKHELKNTRLIKEYQLTPELCLELLDGDEIIFIDAAYGKKPYTLASPVDDGQNNNLSHHISPKMLISMLNSLYGVSPKFKIYSMLTNQFDEIYDKRRYKMCIKEVVDHLLTRETDIPG